MRKCWAVGSRECSRPAGRARAQPRGAPLTGRSGQPRGTCRATGAGGAGGVRPQPAGRGAQGGAQRRAHPESGGLLGVSQVLISIGAPPSSRGRQGAGLPRGRVGPAARGAGRGSPSDSSRRGWTRSPQVPGRGLALTVEGRAPIPPSGHSPGHLAPSRVRGGGLESSSSQDLRANGRNAAGACGKMVSGGGAAF